MALALPSLADAHTLTVARAKAAAKRAAAALPEIPGPVVEVRTCRRSSPHQVICQVVAAEEAPSRGAQVCTLDVAVRFASRVSRRVVATRRNVVCETPGMPGPAPPPTVTSANTLSVARARTAIDREIGFVFEDYHRAVPTFRTCVRRSAHAVRCSLDVAFERTAGTGPTGVCTGSITAVLGHRSGRVRTNYLTARNRTFTCPSPGAP